MSTHGTHSGYVQHRARGEDACDACKKAHTIYYKQWRQRRLGQKLPELTPRDKSEATPSFQKAVAALAHK